MSTKPDHIQLDGLQKITELEAEDKYKVLEFLVKEMIGVRQQEKERRYSSRERRYESRRESTDRYERRHEQRKSSTEAKKPRKIDVGKVEPTTEKKEFKEQSISDQLITSR